jgi:ubiquinol-cytochrome c reductase cytochrome b subunit
VIVQRAVNWADDRLRFSALARTGLNKVFPDHWSFMLGEIALYAFVFLVGSGTFLTFFFDPSESETTYSGHYGPLDGDRVSSAYASAIHLSYDVRLGLVLRQAHHWAALVFIGAMLVHLCRIFFTGAFRRPREINWLVGVTMLVLGIVNGFVGYSMPDDLLSGTGLRIANAILLSLPVVGPWVSFLVFGGEFPGDQILHRLYITHVLIVPALLAALITVHLIVIVRQKHSQFPGPGRTEHNVVGSRMWPAYAAKSVALLFAVSAVCLLLGGVAQINPIWLYGPFEPGSATSPAQPDWYIGWVDGALRLYPPWEPDIFGYRLPNVFVPGVVMPAVSFLALYAWPWVDKLLTRDAAPHQVLQRPRDAPLRLAVGGTALTFYTLLLLTFSNDVIARFLHIPVSVLLYALRGVDLVVPLVVGAVAFVLARALKLSDAPGLTSLAWHDVVAGARRRPRPERERQPQPEPESGARRDEAPEPVRVEVPAHAPVEAGPVP